MRIVFYSTNSNMFDEETFKIKVMPENSLGFADFCAAHPEHEFFCVTQKPGMFLPENNSDSDNQRIRYLPLETDTEAFTRSLLELKPDQPFILDFTTEEEFTNTEIRKLCFLYV